ncbi:MAG: hypothetical protein RLZZ316_1710 [Bacteroidota bacterium]
MHTKKIKLKWTLLLTIIFLAACANKQKSITARQEAILQKMAQVKIQYYKKTDLLQAMKHTDTSAIKQQQIAKQLVAADGVKINALIALQKEYDSLEVVLKKYKGGF